MHVVCINLKDNEKNILMCSNDNTVIHDDNKIFDSLDHERGYCVCARTWWIEKLMIERKADIFYMDADIFLKSNILELFEIQKTCDIMVRAKEIKPNFRCNAGMIYIKNNEKNIKIVSEWKKRCINYGIKWMSDQNSLNDIIQKYFNVLNEITYKNFPEKFNGISTNPNSVIVHMKGPKKLEELK